MKAAHIKIMDQLPVLPSTANELLGMMLTFKYLLIISTVMKTIIIIGYLCSGQNDRGCIKNL